MRPLIGELLGSAWIERKVGPFDVTVAVDPPSGYRCLIVEIARHQTYRPGKSGRAKGFQSTALRTVRVLRIKRYRGQRPFATYQRVIEMPSHDPGGPFGNYLDWDLDSTKTATDRFLFAHTRREGVWGQVWRST